LEEKRLLTAVIPAYLKSMIRIFLNSGLRRKELFQLTWQNVNFERRQIYIKETKTAKNRYVPLNEAVHHELMKLFETRKSDGQVFVNPKTRKEYVCIRKAFQGACRRAGIENLTLPDLRRTFATRLIEASADIITVQQLLGHTSVTTTQIYTMTNQDEKRKAVSLLDAPNRAVLARIWPTEQDEQLPHFKQNHLISMN
jgi:integrase